MRRRRLNRLLDLRYERTNGLFMGVLALLLIVRPSASALTALQAAYGIAFGVDAYIVLLLACSVLLLTLPLKRLRFRVYAALTLPIILYTGCLLWVFFLDAKIGAIGWMFGVYIWLNMLFQYRPQPANPALDTPQEDKP